MQGRTAQQQQAIVAIVLRSLVPAPVLALIRTCFDPTPLVCELNAWFATLLFQWLVGPCTVRSVEIVTPEGKRQQQNSEVYIQKCRYLEQTRCVGLCTNMCKLPTQAFFQDGFGIPLTLTPNFEDFSCEMVFGQVPRPLEEEPLYQQPCLLHQCPSAVTTPIPCPKVRN